MCKTTQIVQVCNCSTHSLWALTMTSISTINILRSCVRIGQCHHGIKNFGINYWLYSTFAWFSCPLCSHISYHGGPAGLSQTTSYITGIISSVGTEPRYVSTRRFSLSLRGSVQHDWSSHFSYWLKSSADNYPSSCSLSLVIDYCRGIPTKSVGHNGG